MKKNTLLIITFFCIQVVQSQQKSTLLKGQVLDSYFKKVESVHIVNLTTKIGTISDARGEFEIKGRKGDWIEISHINYQNKKFRITERMIFKKTILIYIKQLLNHLEEVKLIKRLKGVLALDRANDKKDSIPKIDKNFYNFSKMDFTTIDKTIKKANVLKELNSSIQNTDPTRKFAPITLVSAGIPDKSSIKKRAQRKTLEYKKSLPFLIIKEFKESFFIENLKIPKDKIFHFLDYCNLYGLERLYKEKKILEVLKILLKESKSYLQIIEKQQ